MIIQLDFSVCFFRVYMLTAFQYLPLHASLENVNSSSTMFIDYLSQDYLIIEFPISSFFLIQSSPLTCCQKWSKVNTPKYDCVTAQIKILQHLLISAKEKKSLNLLLLSYPFKTRTHPSFQMSSWITPSPKTVATSCQSNSQHKYWCAKTKPV